MKAAISSRVALILRLIVGGVFVYASLDKIAFPADFARIVQNYGILPEKIGEFFAFVLPWVELILGILIIVGIFIRPTAALISMILVVFIVAVIYKSLNGTLENCGCFSTSQEAGKQSPILLVGRNLLLIISGLIIFFKKTNKNIENERRVIQ